MYRIEYMSSRGVRTSDYDNEKEARADLKWITKDKDAHDIKLIHFKRAIKPSLAPITAPGNGYAGHNFTGWKEMESSRIVGAGYKVSFFAFAEETIDPMCDALNGWHSVWVKYRAEFERDGKQVVKYARAINEIDDLFTQIERFISVNRKEWEDWKEDWAKGRAESWWEPPCSEADLISDVFALHGPK